MSSIAPGQPNTGWLDEELRKQKTTIADLHTLVDQQHVTIIDQTQRIVTLEDRLAKLQAQLARIPEVEEALRYTRDQMGVMLSDLRQEQQKAQTEFLRNRQAEREQDSHAVQAIQVELQRFDPLEQGMAVRQAEERRLNEVLLRVQQGLDEAVKRAGQREDRWRGLSERQEQIAVRISQVASEQEDLQKARQEQLARTLLLETWQNKTEQQISELQNVRGELVRKQDELLEGQRRSDRERAQLLAEYGRRIEAFAGQLEQWAEQIRFFADQHERNRRVLRDVQELAQQVSQQQEQLRQTQRLAEEQLRREFREWRSEVDRRWAQEMDRRDRVQQAQAERDDAQERRLADLEQFRQDDLASVQALAEQLKLMQVNLLGEITNVRKAQMLAMRRQAKAFADLVAELHGLLGDQAD